MKKLKNKKKKKDKPTDIPEIVEEIIIEPKKLQPDYNNRPEVRILDRCNDNSILVSISKGCGDGIYELSISESIFINNLIWTNKSKENENMLWLSDSNVLVQNLAANKTYYLRARQEKCQKYEGSMIGPPTEYKTFDLDQELNIEELISLKEEAMKLTDENQFNQASSFKKVI